MEYKKILNPTKIFFALLGATILMLLWLIIIRLLGYQLNREFFTFNKQQCIAKELPTYAGHSGIEGCIFWSRNDYLENKEDWKALFTRNENYCKQTYGLKDNMFIDFKVKLDLSFRENRDPKCDYEGVRDQKRKENWDYLTSKEKDQFYYSCVEKICPSQPLFK